MFGAFVSRIKRKSLTIFLFLTWYCFCIHFYVTICMKLDPGMHLGLHLVFFGKSGVTVVHWQVTCWRMCPLSGTACNSSRTPICFITSVSSTTGIWRVWPLGILAERPEKSCKTKNVVAALRCVAAGLWRKTKEIAAGSKRLQEKNYEVKEKKPDYYSIVMQAWHHQIL
jgi:hypothetical protein